MTATRDWRALPPSAKARLRDKLRAEAAERQRAAWTPYPWQTPPADIPTHGMWLMMGGRGTGKTDGAARYVSDHVRGPACDPRVPGGHRIAIVAPTLGDAVESCINGPSGLKAHDPLVRLASGLGGAHVRWPGGSEAKLFGCHTADDIERLRSGGNRCLVWMEEAAAMRHLGAAYEHTALGLRIGAHPHFVASTTPKPLAALRELIADPLTLITKGRTAEAIHLDAAVRDRLIRKYAGTRLGRQELDGELLADVEGALWTYDHIAAGRVLPGEVPELVRVGVGMDPSVSVTETSDECGLVAGGLGADGHVYILEDRSGKFAGSEAARRAWQLWADVGADEIIYEDNQGKAWVADVLRQVWRQMQKEGILPPGNAPLKAVTAIIRKRLRADPIATMYEPPAEVHHAGIFPELEDQQTTWLPESGESPDRLDALVHLVQHLAGRSLQAGFASAVNMTRTEVAGASQLGPGAVGVAGSRFAPPPATGPRSRPMLGGPPGSHR